MKRKDKFYIGWQDDMPKSTKSFLQKFIGLCFIIILVVAFVLVYFQRSFNTFSFQLGNVQEYTGILHMKPVPILELTSLPKDVQCDKWALLVGYGKFGAEGILQEIEKTNGNLDGKEIKLKGTLIHGDGKTVIELTKKEKSLAEVGSPKKGEFIGDLSAPLRKELSGEIIDPKCYFGVMKPGEGKIHKSCAIRCISGGIPPVLKTNNSESSKFDYYLILGNTGEKINMNILDFVAEPVTISGATSNENGWKVLFTDPSKIIINESL